MRSAKYLLILCSLTTPIQIAAMQGEPREPVRFTALAWASDHLNFSVSTGYDSRQSAETAAREACAKTTGVECSHVVSTRDGVIAMASPDDGGRVVMEGLSNAHSSIRVLEECSQKGRRCAITHWFDGRYDNRGPSVRNLMGDNPIPDMWGTIAYRADRFPSHVSRIWAVSQRASQEDAIRSALELCVRGEKAECKAKAGVRNTFFGVYASDSEPGTPTIESDVDEERLQAVIDSKCALISASCVTFIRFDVRQPVAEDFVLGKN
jgi:Domain of unknown function (DUF4189)